MMEGMNEGYSNQNTSVSMQQPLLSEHSSQFMQHLLDPSNFLETIERQLKGEVWDSTTRTYKKVGKGKMNDEGVGWVMTELKTFTDKIFQTTYYTSAEIERDIESFEHDLIDHLFAHNKEYELNIIADLNVIYHLVSHTVYAVRKKSQEARFFKGLSSSTQHTEVISERPQQRNAGMMNKLRNGLNL